MSRKVEETPFILREGEGSLFLSRFTTFPRDVTRMRGREKSSICAHPWERNLLYCPWMEKEKWEKSVTDCGFPLLLSVHREKGPKNRYVGPTSHLSLVYSELKSTLVFQTFSFICSIIFAFTFILSLPFFYLEKMLKRAQSFQSRWLHIFLSFPFFQFVHEK